MASHPPLRPDVPAVEAPTSAESVHPEAPTVSKKKKKRKRKVSGQPGFRWVTSTDPSQFRDESVRRTVRSHVMQDHAHRTKGKHFEPCTTSAFVENSSHQQEINTSKLPAISDSSTPGQDYNTRALVKAGTNVLEGSVIEMHGGMLTLSVLERLAAHLDPLGYLPDFPSPRKHVQELQKFCVDYFASTVYQEIPTHTRNFFLSGMCVASTRRDVLRGLLQESSTTAAVKLEAIRMLNQSLSDPRLQTANHTFLCLVRLLHSEIVHGDPTVLEVHIRGIEHMIELKGGLQQFASESECSNWVCKAITHVIYQLSIHTETQPHQMFLDFISLSSKPILPPPLRGNPELPTYLPGNFWHCVAKDSRCSPYTWETICDFRDAMGLLLSHQSAGSAAIQEASDWTGSKKEESEADFRRKSLAILNRIVLRPSAEDPNSPTFGDWVYESVRIVAHIYANAVFHKVPFSTATTFAEETILPKSDCPSVPERLRAAIERTDLDPENCWGPTMTRVLFWITLIGGASANTLGAQSETRPYAAQVSGGFEAARRWLVSLSLRTTIIIAVGSKELVLGAMRRLIQMQELLGSAERT